MSNKQIASMIVALGLVLGIFGVQTYRATLNRVNKSINLGEASLGGGYSFKNVTSSNASSTASVVVKGGSGVLGHIVIASSSASVIGVYDGTATSTGTVIGTIKASASEQTLTYDAAFLKGLSLDIPASFNGNITILYK